MAEKTKRIVVPVEVDLRMDDYEDNYGTNDSAEAENYVGEIVRNAADERFKLLGWATIVGAPKL